MLVTFESRSASLNLHYLHLFIHIHLHRTIRLWVTIRNVIPIPPKQLSTLATNLHNLTWLDNDFVQYTLHIYWNVPFVHFNLLVSLFGLDIDRFRFVSCFFFFFVFIENRLTMLSVLLLVSRSPILLWQWWNTFNGSVRICLDHESTLFLHFYSVDIDIDQATILGLHEQIFVLFPNSNLIFTFSFYCLLLLSVGWVPYS